MSQIESGECFVITRGFQYGDTFMFDYAMFGREPSSTPPDKKYDRSHEGAVYLAMEVCGPVIAAKCIHGSETQRKYFANFSLNTTEVEVWPVTKTYLDSLEIEVPSMLAAQKESRQ